MSEPFSAALLPQDVAPSDTLYVTDRDLNVVYSNDEWDTFAKSNKGQKLLGASWSRNLLDNLSGRQRERWEHIYRLLRDGRLPHHQEQMNCSSPEQRRIYELRITPAVDASGEVAWLVHHNVRVDDEVEAVDRVPSQLGNLDRPEQLAEEFRKRIVERKVRIPSYDVARYFEPLDEIGGDLVWHREYPDGTSDLIHADVMGHGTHAGLFAARIAVLLDELGARELPPALLVAALNRALLRLTPDEEVMFATGLCMRFDQTLQRVTLCNFGHEGPIFSRTGQIDIIGGRPVGLAEWDRPWGETQLDLSEHGQRFLVFSDGITEQFNAEGEMFGPERLGVAFRKHLDAPLDDMVSRVIAELAAFQGSALVKDDQTLLALEFKSADAT